MKKCKVLIEHLVHDGKRCKTGQVITLADEQVAPLEAIGAVEEITQNKGGKPKDQA